MEPGCLYSALEEAMRYGSRGNYKPGDLGRYGLGLKTASLSQCRCLTVASRRSLERRRIEICCWDLTTLRGRTVGRYSDRAGRNDSSD